MLDKLQQGWRQPRLLNYLLRPISWCYVLLVKLRQGCYRTGICKSSALPVPVIVVGNISVGGSGKSPLVMALVNHLKAKGFRPGVISRGYGGKSTFWPREVNKATSAQLVGDEPQLIFERCDVAVVVGPNRVQNGYYLIDKMNCDILISDDGYQHFALQRTIDIAVIDGAYRFGNGWCLPAGPLREPISALKRADIVAIKNPIRPGICRDIPRHCPVRFMHMTLQNAHNLLDGRHRKLAKFADNTVHVMAGIGNAHQFFCQIKDFGINIIPHAFPDHYQFTETDLFFADHRQVLMTEKDGVKCRAVVTAKNLRNMWIVPAYLRVDERLYQCIDDLLVQRSDCG